MRKSVVDTHTFGVLNFLLEGKGADDDEEAVIEAIASINRRMSECTRKVAKEKDRP